MPLNFRLKHKGWMGVWLRRSTTCFQDYWNRKKMLLLFCLHKEKFQDQSFSKMNICVSPGCIFKMFLTTKNCLQNVFDGEHLCSAQVVFAPPYSHLFGRKITTSWTEESEWTTKGGFVHEWHQKLFLTDFESPLAGVALLLQCWFISWNVTVRCSIPHPTRRSIPIPYTSPLTAPRCNVHPWMVYFYSVWIAPHCCSLVAMSIHHVVAFYSR